MIQPFLIALQNHLKTAEVATVVDHWNNQTANYEKEIQAITAVYIDFGSILWTKAGNGIKQATADINVHCVGKNIQPTHAGAPGTDAQRLKRFNLSQHVLSALEGITLKDADGLVIIQRLKLTASQMDTNHDTLTDDVLTFTGKLYYYDTWREKEWHEITLEGVVTEYDPTIVVGQ